MKRIFILIIMIVGFSVANACENDDLLNTCQKWLSENGISFQIEKRVLYFEYQGGTFVVTVPEDDKSFLHLVMPCVYEVSEEESCRVLENLNLINQETKCVKAVLIDSDVWLIIDMLVESTSGIDTFFERLLGILHETRWELSYVLPQR